MNSISKAEMDRILDKVGVSTEPLGVPHGDEARCPVCKGEHSHIEKVVSLSDRDNRRESWALVFRGECGHDWIVSYIQFKGVTSISQQVIDINAD